MKILALALLVTLGCKSKPEPEVTVTDRMTGEVIPKDEVPSELIEKSRAVGEKQARGFAGGSITVHKVWPYRGALEVAAEGAQAIAAEITVTLATDSFDFDDIDIIDAADDKNYGSDPHLQRLTPEGEPVSWTSPGLPANTVRFVGLWAVPATTKAIKLGYWGQTLTAAIPIGTTPGPDVPVEKFPQPLAHATVGTLPNGETRHLLLLECFCARDAYAPSYQLVDPPKRLRYPVKIVEVDDKLEPLAPGATLPNYGTRRWVVEVRAAAATQYNQYGTHSPLPATPLAASKTLLAALEAAPLDKLGADMDAER